MPTIHDTPPAPVQTDLNSLAQTLNTVIPAKNDTNLLIATWNLRRFGSLTREWTADAADTPKRDLRGLRAICEIVARFDVVAICGLNLEFDIVNKTLTCAVLCFHPTYPNFVSFCDI
jgi:hypothetical protein